jgi:hypothetical protein
LASVVASSARSIRPVNCRYWPFSGWISHAPQPRSRASRRIVARAALRMGSPMRRHVR